MVNRTGYTGEKGVELMVMAEDAGALWDAVLERGATPCGLGARDTLRLEVCYPLHGNDIGPDTDAISAGLGWVCALDTEFTGAEELRRIKAEGPRAEARRLRHAGRRASRARGWRSPRAARSPPARTRRCSTSGIGMGYVPAEHAEPGSTLTIDVRGRARRAESSRSRSTRGRSVVAAAESYPGRPALQRGARLGPHRGRRGDRSASPGSRRTRSASSSTSSRPRRAPRSRRARPTARSSR